MKRFGMPYLTAWFLKMRAVPFRTNDEDEPPKLTDMDYFVAGIPIATGLAIMAWVLFVPATRPPSASSLVACFITEEAPSVQFDGQRIRLGQRNLGGQAYHFVLQKYGTLSIDADPGLMLREARDGKYVFVAGRPPYSNSTMTLLHEVSGKLWPVFKTEDAQFLDIDIDQGDTLTFRRARASECIPDLIVS